MNGIDWGQVISVALSGISSVFAVLIILMISVLLAGTVISSFTKKS